MKAAKLALRNVVKQFGDSTVIDDISLDIMDGEFLTLLGPSGCGKSTLLRIIAGLTPIQSGSLEIDGRSVSHMPPRKRGVAMVFQNYALYPHLSVKGNLSVPLELNRMSVVQRLPLFGGFAPGSREIRRGIEAEVADVAKVLELEALLDRKPHQLSGGQRQRVALGRAMVRKPSLFLMDEPLANLDANLRGQMRTQITALQRRMNVPFVFVTHDQSEAMTMSDRIAVIFNGRIRQIGTPFEIYNNPADLAVAAFMSHPSLNVWHVETLADGLAQFGGHKLHVPCGLAGAPTLAFRPEHVLVQPKDTQLHVPGRVGNIELLGSDALLHVIVDGADAPVVARIDADTLPCYTPGGNVWIAPDTRRCWGFDGDARRVSPIDAEVA